MKSAIYYWAESHGWVRTGGALDCACPQLVLYFGDREQLSSNTPALEELTRRFPDAAIFGCSSAGEICGPDVKLEGISALAVQFESSHCRFAKATIASVEDSHEGGRCLGDLLPHDQLRGVLILSDGTSVNGSKLVSGLLEGLPANIPLFGGLAGDGARFASTLVGIGANLEANRVVAIGFYGENLEILCGSAGGWEPFGPLRRITKSEGNVLIELDNVPALSVYKRYLGERASELPAGALLFPLAVYTNEADQEGIVRTILTLDEEAQTMTFAGDMPLGAHARLMHASSDRLMLGAQTAADRALSQTHTGPVDLAILVSCVGRRLVLGQRAEDEVDEVLNVIGSATPAIGFYSYGEISSASPGLRCELHNQTMTLTLFRERSETSSA